MAGRPVAARGGGGILYGLIAFVIVAVGALGGFVWQLTSNEQLKTENERASRSLDKYGNPPSYYDSEASARGSTVFNVMNDDIRQLATLTAGKPEAVRPAIVEGANKLLQSVSADTGAFEPGDTLLTALSKLHDAFAKLRSEQATLRTDFAQLQDDKDALDRGLKEVRDQFEQQVDELQGELEQVQQDKADQLAAKDEQLASQQAESEAIAKEVSDLKVQLRKSEENYDIDVTRLRGQIADLQAKIAQLKPGGFDPYDILTKADGRVLRAIPGSDVIYINLGSVDRVRPGLTFEVFSPIEGERGEGVRGKASVEVTAVLDSTAECRVIRAIRGRPIVEGDIGVNIAYERNRLPKFVVRGDFDLDYDGEKDWNGAEKVEAIIRAWGGQVVPEVDESTDFLVVGMGPQAPLPTGDRPVSDVIRDLADTRLDKLAEFERDIEQARTLYIPVITQNQFLYLTGYSGRGPVATD